MPAQFLGGGAVTTVVFLLNRAPTKAMEGRTPFEAYTRRKSAVDFLHTFDCLSFVEDKRPGLKKLVDRSAPMVFNGYSEGAKAYKLFDPTIGRVHTSRNVIFDECRGWAWSTKTSNGESATQQEFTVKYYTVCTPADDAKGVPPRGASKSSAAHDVPQPELETPPPHEMVDPEFATPMEEDGDRLDAFHGDTPVHYRRVNNILGEAGLVPGRAERVMACAQRGRPRRVQEELQLVAGDMESATRRG
jgi:hypothetical protein